MQVTTISPKTKVQVQFWRVWRWRKFLDWGTCNLYRFFAIGPIEVRFFAAIPDDTLSIELTRIDAMKCLHCNKDVTDDNNSGWLGFHEYGDRPICTDCHKERLSWVWVKSPDGNSIYPTKDGKRVEG